MQEMWAYDCIAEANSKTAGTAKPTSFFLGNQGLSTNVATTPINNVALLENML